MKVVVIGVGYVGIHLVNIFQKKYRVIGYDCDINKISALNDGIDRSGELSKKEIDNLNNVIFTGEISDICGADVYIVCVPTPIDVNNKPDLTALKEAMITVGKVLKHENTVVIESTISPGTTENICIPILEEYSNLHKGVDFHVGFSPERINPGDKMHLPEKCEKIVSGLDDESLKIIFDIYSSVWEGPIFRAASIRVAEAAKLLENIQRDVNIALINEINLLFRDINIDIYDVIKAASGKWNYMPFYPGLVGGHCIGVDPYYLIDLAQKQNINLSIVESARTINEYIPEMIAEELLRLFRSRTPNLKVGILGITFKENCSDTRNSKVVKIVEKLKNAGCEVDVSDPIANLENVKKEYGIELTDWRDWNDINMLVLAVSHNYYQDELIEQIAMKLVRHNGEKPVLADVKGVVSKEVAGDLSKRGIFYWRY